MESDKEKDTKKKSKDTPTEKESKRHKFLSFFHKSSTSAESEKRLITQPGLCGLSNLGNTCFMNSALQCLSNTPRLNTYFSNGEYKKDVNKHNPIGMKGQLADAFGDLMKRMWSGENTTLAPRTFKMTLGKWAPQFSGYNQNDSQELLSFLLDGLHEDINKISKKPYVKSVEDDGSHEDSLVAREAWKVHLKRNKSLIVDLFQGQLKSTVICAICHHKSVKFDPFMYLSLPIPNNSIRPIELVVVPYGGSAKKMPVRYGLSVSKYATIDEVKKALSPLCGIPEPRLALAQLSDGNRSIQRFMSSSLSLASTGAKDALFFYELPVIPKPSKESEGKDKKIFRVCFVHRIESAKKKSVFRLKGLPFVIDFCEDVTADSIYDSVWKRYKFLFSKAAKSPPFSTYGDDSEKMHDFHNRDECKRREYPFTISSVSYMSSCCGICKSGCTGCHIGCKAQSVPWDDFVHNGRVVYMSVDWCLKCVRKMKIDLSQLGCVSVHETCLTVRAKLKKTISLDDCMQLFSTEERLSEDDLWYCPHCQKHRIATKKMDIWKLPEILVVHLKRFKFSASRREKLNVNVSFKSKWDLKPFVLVNSENDGNSTAYKMYAGSYHIGSLSGGHYIAYAKNRVDNNWYCFNDNQCTKVSESDIHSDSAYVLFYRRVKRDESGAESLSSSGGSSEGDEDVGDPPRVLNVCDDDDGSDDEGEIDGDIDNIDKESNDRQNDIPNDRKKSKSPRQKKRTKGVESESDD